MEMEGLTPAQARTRITPSILDFLLDDDDDTKCAKSKGSCDADAKGQPGISFGTEGKNDLSIILGVDQNKSKVKGLQATSKTEAEDNVTPLLGRVTIVVLTLTFVWLLPLGLMTLGLLSQTQRPEFEVQIQSSISTSTLLPEVGGHSNGTEMILLSAPDSLLWEERRLRRANRKMRLALRRIREGLGEVREESRKMTEVALRLNKEMGKVSYALQTLAESFFLVTLRKLGVTILLLMMGWILAPAPMMFLL